MHLASVLSPFSLLLLLAKLNCDLWVRDGLKTGINVYCALNLDKNSDEGLPSKMPYPLV